MGYQRRQQQCDPSHFKSAVLTASSIGIGTYLGPIDDQTDGLMRQAIVDAIAQGINVVDTAINYRHQRSERAVGQALQRVFNEGIAAREEIIVCSKGGFVPHPDRVAWFRETYVEQPNAAIAMADLAEQRHCMHPEYLRDQLHRSLENLGLETIDIYYLHNPEAQLSAVSPEVFYERLEAAFAVLENAVVEGKIGAYGIATWDAFRVPSTQPAHIDLAKAQSIAQAVSKSEKSAFEYIQLPLNLLMLEGANQATQTQATQTIDGQSVTAIQAAETLGLTPIASAALAQGDELEKMLPFLDFARNHPLTLGQQALQFTRSVPGIATALVGMKKAEHVEANLKLVSIPALEPAVVKTILQATHAESK